MNVKCPMCGCDGFELLIEYVDIGVGVQEHVMGGECIECGSIPVCSDCGDFGGGHRSWCPGAMGDVGGHR